MVRGTNSFHEPLHARRGSANGGLADGSLLTNTLLRALVPRWPHEYSRSGRPLKRGGAPRELRSPLVRAGPTIGHSPCMGVDRAGAWPPTGHARFAYTSPACRQRRRHVPHRSDLGTDLLGLGTGQGPKFARDSPSPAALTASPAFFKQPPAHSMAAAGLPPACNGVRRSAGSAGRLEREDILLVRVPVDIWAHSTHGRSLRSAHMRSHFAGRTPVSTKEPASEMSDAADQASAEVGSSTAATRLTRLAGKPLSSACSWIARSSSAM